MGREGQDGPHGVTEALEALRQGSPGAQEQLIRILYAELHRLAASQMNRQRRGHTLQPTALVNEAYLRLMGVAEPAWKDRAHFLTAAARAMRSVLVDFARRRGALKRGGGKRNVTLDEGSTAGAHAMEEVVAIHEALEKLEALDAQAGQVVELRFFAGLSMKEAAQVMGVSERTVYHAWEHARAWLYREIGS